MDTQIPKIIIKIVPDEHVQSVTSAKFERNWNHSFANTLDKLFFKAAIALLLLWISIVIVSKIRKFIKWRNMRMESKKIGPNANCFKIEIDNSNNESISLAPPKPPRNGSQKKPTELVNEFPILNQALIGTKF